MGLGLGSLNPVRIVQGKGDVGEALGPLAPVAVGLGLNAVAPGLGAAVGSSLGLGAAAGTGALVGGITALASGNLQQGLMAGLGAYGGASIGAGLSNMGAGVLANAAGETNISSANAVNGMDLASDQAMGAGPSTFSKMGAGLGYAAENPMEALSALGSGSALAGAGILGAAAAPMLAGNMVQTTTPAPTATESLIRPYEFSRQVNTPQDMVGATYTPGQSTRERNWITDKMTALEPYKAPGPEYKMAVGGPVEGMSTANSVGLNTGYPQAATTPIPYATPWQTPVSQNVVTDAADTGVNRMTGEMNFAGGGLSSLGGYAKGGSPRLLQGPGDGMSDNIPAVIGDKQPARLADGEFVVPADVVSHLGNGSTDAGAKQLYKMMDRIRQQRTGKKRQAPQVNPSKAMPA